MRLKYLFSFKLAIMKQEKSPLSVKKTSNSMKQNKVSDNADERIETIHYLFDNFPDSVFCFNV